VSKDGIKYWVIIPAAGCGSRMQQAIPKQYLPLAGKPVILHTIEVFASHPLIDGIVVATAADDRYWQKLALPAGKPIIRIDGGDERCHSVLNALDALQEQLVEDDWILVHDAARPCLERSDLDSLMEHLEGRAIGGLLGVPVRDTMKRTDSEHNVYETVDRKQLWHAGTPQMFRYGLLRSSLIRALDNNILVTDEAAAIELAGKKPHIVEGSSRNIKITRAEDLALAEFYLSG
jgi:2-C-methyl-D-erythritol 4-phosphate cytidylyltransferase